MRKAGEREISQAARLYTRSGYRFVSASTQDNVRISDLSEHEANDLKDCFGGTTGYAERLGWHWTANYRKARVFLAAISEVAQ